MGILGKPNRRRKSRENKENTKTAKPRINHSTTLKNHNKHKNDERKTNRKNPQRSPKTPPHQRTTTKKLEKYLIENTDTQKNKQKTSGSKPSNQE